MMPQGLVDRLTLKELSSLLAFLATTKYTDQASNTGNADTEKSRPRRKAG